MSYTNPNGMPQGYPNYFTNKLREAIIGEIIAINGYAEHIANSTMPVVNQVWHHIMEDEKEHYGKFLTLLLKYDPDEYQEYLSHTKDRFPNVQMQEYKPDYDKQLILNNIREDIKGELEAVILYEQIMAEMPYQDIRDTFYTIITAEKEHTEHLTKLLVSLDKDEYDGIT